jgi:hypothetical protein
VSQREGALCVGVIPCEEHGGFASVRKALSMLHAALEEAHEKLSPGPLPEQEPARRAG